MEYLKHNPQRKESSILRELATKLICKRHNVRSHYSLYLAYFIDLLRLNNKKISVCEIGGADGWAISHKSRNIARKVMIDYDDAYKVELEKQGVHFIHASLGKGEIKISENFDIVILNHVIEHIPDYTTAINELYKMTKKGGFVVVRCPNILVNKFNFWNDFTHVKPYTPNSLERAFKSHGFKTTLLRKFSYNFFTIGYFFNKHVQNLLSQINADEILYIGRK